MIRPDRLDQLLDVAMNTADHAGYLAAARVHWPEALLDLREAYELIDEANARILRAAKQLEMADRLYEAGRKFCEAMVKHGPSSPESDVAAGTFFITQGEYREAKERAQ